MSRVILILFYLCLFSTSSFALDSIYTWGYGEVFHKVMQGVVILAGEDYMFKSAVAIGGLLLMIKNMNNNGSSSDMAYAMGKYLVLVTLILGFFVESKKQYMIEDEVTGQTWVINNVPAGIGETFSLFTILERNLGKGFETAFATPNSVQYSKVGLGFTMSSALNIGDVKIIDTYVRRSFNEYINNCVLSAVAAGEMDGDILSTSKNLKDDLLVNGYLTPYYSAANPNGVDSQCQDAWANIKTKIDSHLNKLEQTAAGMMNIDQTNFSTAMSESSKLLFGISQNSKDYIMQQTMINLSQDGITSAALSTGGDASAIAYAKAVAETNQKQTWMTTGILAKENLPLMKAVMTILILGIFMLLVILSVIYGDLGHVKMGFTLLFAMVLWTPLALLINGMMNIAIESILPIMTGGGLTAGNVTNVNEKLQNYLAFLGYMAASIPIFAYSIAKKSEHGFVSLFGGVGAASTSAASSATSQTSTGNVSLGNGRVGGFHSTDVHGQNNYLGNKSFDHSYLADNGSMRSEKRNAAGEGSSSSDAGGYSDGIQFGKNDEVIAFKGGTVEFANNDAIQKTVSEAQAKTKQTSAAFNENFGDTLTHNTSSNKQLIDTSTVAKNLGLNTQDSTTFNKAISDSVQDTLSSVIGKDSNLSFTSESGANLNVHAGVNTDDALAGNALKKLTGFKMGGDGSITLTGKTTEGEAFTVALNESQTKAFQDSFGKNFAQNMSETDGLSYALATQTQSVNGFGDSDTKSLAKTHTDAYTESDSYTKAYNATQSTGTSINKDLKPDVVNKFIEQNPQLFPGMDKKESADATAKMLRDDNYDEKVKDAFVAVVKEKFDVSEAKEAPQKIEEGRKAMEEEAQKSDASSAKVKNDVVETTNNTQEVLKDVPKSKDEIETKNLAIKEEYETKKTQMEDNYKEDMKKFEEKDGIKVKEEIEEKSKILEEQREKAEEKPKLVKALSNLGGEVVEAGDIVTKLDEITSWDGQSGLKTDFKPSKEFIDKTYKDARESGFISNNLFSDDSIKDVSQLKDFSTRELYALHDNDKNSYHLDEPSRDILKDEILKREYNEGKTDNLSVSDTLSPREIFNLNRETAKVQEPTQAPVVEKVETPNTQEQVTQQPAQQIQPVQNNYNPQANPIAYNTVEFGNAHTSGLLDSNNNFDTTKLNQTNDLEQLKAIQQFNDVKPGANILDQNNQELLNQRISQLEQPSANIPKTQEYQEAKPTQVEEKVETPKVQQVQQTPVVENKNNPLHDEEQQRAKQQVEETEKKIKDLKKEIKNLKED